jgi:hypothetical protein
MKRNENENVDVPMSQEKKIILYCITIISIYGCKNVKIAQRDISKSRTQKHEQKFKIFISIVFSLFDFSMIKKIKFI